MPISPRGDPSSGGGRGYDDETAPERGDDPDDGAEAMTSMAAMAKRFNMMRTSPTPTEENELDQFVKTLLEK